MIRHSILFPYVISKFNAHKELKNELLNLIQSDGRSIKNDRDIIENTDLINTRLNYYRSTITLEVRDYDILILDFYYNDPDYVVEGSATPFLDGCIMPVVITYFEDIESGEYPFFESLEKQDLDKIGNMLIEYHFCGGRTIEKDVAILLALLRGAGFKWHISKPHSGGGFIFASRDL
jgi:hypothetical protein